MSSQKYGGIIWTNHALERLGQRGLSQDLAWQTISHPDNQISGKKPGTTEFQKNFGQSLVTVIATQNDQKEWVVLSNWIDPPLYGTEDYKKKEDYRKNQREYKKASFWGRFLLALKKQLGF